MTDNDPNVGAPVAPVSFDFADHIAQQAEYERRRAELLPGNKNALFSKIALKKPRRREERQPVEKLTKAGISDDPAVPDQIEAEAVQIEMILRKLEG